jgi:hypothetical protein
MKQIFICIFLTATIPVFAQEESKAIIRANFKNGNYQAVINEINELYNSDKKNRCLECDIYKAISYCKTNVTKPKPKQCIDWIISAYKPIPPDLQAFLLSFENGCDNFKFPSIDESVFFKDPEVPLVKGKLGNVASRGFSDTVENVKYDEIKKNNDGNIIINIPEFKTWTYNQFVIFSDRNNPEFFESFSDEIVRYMNYFHDSLGMTLPKKKLQIIATGSKNKFDQFTVQYSGIRTPKAQIGFTDLRNNLIYMNIASRGSIFHELFHVMVYETYRSLPPWLEEGMASLFESSTLIDTKLRARQDYRSLYLIKPDDDKKWYQIRRTTGARNINSKFANVDLIDFIGKDWHLFLTTDTEREPIVSFNCALSRLMMLYMLRLGNLKDFFLEAANYDYDKSVNGPMQDYLDIYCKHLKDPTQYKDLKLRLIQYIENSTEVF